MLNDKLQLAEKACERMLGHWGYGHQLTSCGGGAVGTNAPSRPYKVQQAMRDATAQASTPQNHQNASLLPSRIFNTAYIAAYARLWRPCSLPPPAATRPSPRCRAKRRSAGWFCPAECRKKQADVVRAGASRGNAGGVGERQGDRDRTGYVSGQPEQERLGKGAKSAPMAARQVGGCAGRARRTYVLTTARRRIGERRRREKPPKIRRSERSATLGTCKLAKVGSRRVRFGRATRTTCMHVGR